MKKVKVLILGSITSQAYSALGMHKHAYGAGWVENLINSLKEKGLEIYSVSITGEVNEVTYNTLNGIRYISLPEPSGSKEKKMKTFIDLFKDVLRSASPDIVHIIGTEREYNYALFKAFDNPKKTIVSMTGLITFCARHYLGGIDKAELKHRTIGDHIRRWGPLVEQKEFYKASIYEQMLLKEAKYVFGRTSWDMACSYLINPKIEYIHCGEIINPVFSTKEWKISSCEKYSIFISQASYPLKGFHVLLEALPYVLKKFPKTKVYVAGHDMFDSSSFMARIKISTYARYLLRLIKKLKIDKNSISFIGYQNTGGMLKNYLNANVFVLPSSIENSPNSLGEAMSLGVPSIAAHVGGVPDMIESGKNGFTYPSDEPYLLAKRIIEIFDDSKVASELSKNARKSSQSFFNKKDTIDTTVETYNKLLKKR